MQNNKSMKIIEKTYIIAFLIYLLLNSILPYISLKLPIIKNGISLIFMIIGAIIILYNLIYDRKKFTANNAWMLWIFILICIISSIAMIKYGYIDNAKTIIWSSIMFGVLYTYPVDKDKKEMQKTLKVAIIIISIIWAVAILIGIYQYLMQIGYQVKLEDSPIKKAQGFFYNRLFGIFVDPNYAAVTSSIILLVSVYMINISNKVWKKIIWVLNTILQITYIILSGSRTGMLVLAVGIIGYTYLHLKNYFYPNNKLCFKRFISIITVIIICIVGFWGAKTALAKLPNIVNKTSNVQNSEKTNTLDRTDLDNKGISNLRFELWEDSINIWKSKPIFGTSPRNFHQYSVQYDKNSYPGRGYDVGNGYLSVLVYTGICGAIVIAIFIGSTIKKVIPYIIKNKYVLTKMKQLNILALTSVLMVAIAAAINQEVFLINSFNTAIFWLMLGYIMEYIKIKEDTKKEKIGVITIHDADNYGSALQAYATQKVIQNLGYEAIIIDHICTKISNEYGIKRILVQKNIKAIIETIIRILTIYPSRVRFKDFRNTQFVLENELEVIKKQDNFKKFVVGSDQVWNYKITGFDKAYFLDFVEDNNKKISFASSFGLTEIEEGKKEEYKELLTKFKALNVREEQAVTLIKDLTNRDANLVLDPTLLISKEEWQSITKPKSRYEGYILCYQIAYSQSLVDFAEELSRKTGKKIISIQGSMRHKFNAKYIWNAGPIEYIQLFLNADYIITNSFHGTAFSINFNKNFFTELLPSFEKTSSRLESILDLFELRSRQIIDGKNENMLKNIDYTKVNEILKVNKEKSISILKTSIEGDNA